MAYIEWQDWMKIGVPMVDDDHKVLIRLINQVHSCTSAAEEYFNLASVLRTLEDYTDYHFQREERLQEEVGFPGAVGHRQLHEKISGQVCEIVRRYETAKGSVRAVDILTFLEHWLTDHILNHDMAYRSYAVGNDAAAEIASQVGMGHVRGASPPRPFDWNGLRVLVVDDNSHFLTLMETILSGVGVGYVKLLPSAAEGLEFLARNPVDAVISDWNMAGMDGVEFVVDMRLSADPIIANVAIMMVSGHGGDEMRAKATAAGVDAFIEKPVSARDLLLTLARLVTEKRS